MLNDKQKQLVARAKFHFPMLGEFEASHCFLQRLKLLTFEIEAIIEMTIRNESADAEEAEEKRSILEPLLERKAKNIENILDLEEAIQILDKERSK